MKSNIKSEILKIIEEKNLQLLKIDCCNMEYIYLNHLPVSKRDSFKDIYPSAKQYLSIEELDFDYDTEDFDFLCGTVYCIDKESKEPVWLCRVCDECNAWWEVNRIPNFFYKDIFSIIQAKSIYQKI